MAYGVDQFTSPQAKPRGHQEWDIEGGEPISRFVPDYDEDGQKIEEEEV